MGRDTKGKQKNRQRHQKQQQSQQQQQQQQQRQQQQQQSQPPHQQQQQQRLHQTGGGGVVGPEIRYMDGGVGMTRGWPLLGTLVMYLRWDMYQFNVRLVRYHRDPRHRQDRDRHVEVPR